MRIRLKYINSYSAKKEHGKCQGIIACEIAYMYKIHKGSAPSTRGIKARTLSLATEDLQTLPAGVGTV